MTFLLKIFSAQRTTLTQLMFMAVREEGKDDWKNRRNHLSVQDLLDGN